ncbi:MAG: efflux RND transporter permease subunit [Acidobacteriota bacterium]|nr:efflux RND transporter permease subunit [Acidobacteriota bacterium]
MRIQTIQLGPCIAFTFGGEQQHQLESLDALYRGFVLAMLAIFALLPLSQGSYVRPFLVMAIIPFGLVGVVPGHYVLGVPISAASLMGFFGLSGVTINDSLVRKDLIDQRRREGADAKTAIIDGAKGRFRPIILTSVTTFLGFTPLILERAIQAQFLVPFAASLGVGIMITTGILLLLVPALLAVNLRANSRHRAAGAVPVP